MTEYRLCRDLSNDYTTDGVERFQGLLDIDLLILVSTMYGPTSIVSEDDELLRDLQSLARLRLRLRPGKGCKGLCLGLYVR